MSNAPVMLDPSGGLAPLLDGMNNELTDRMALLTITPNVVHNVEDYLVNGLQVIRFAMINDEIVLDDIWRNIRGQEVLVDLIVDLTNSLHFQASLTFPGGWDQLVNFIVQSVTCFNHAHEDNKTSVWNNTDEMPYFANPERLLEFTQANPWLITLYLLRRVTFVRELMHATAARAAKARVNASTGGT